MRGGHHSQVHSLAPATLAIDLDCPGRADGRTDVVLEGISYLGPAGRNMPRRGGSWSAMARQGCRQGLPARIFRKTTLRR